MHNPISSWISISLYHDQLDKLIHDVVIPVTREIQKQNLSSRVMFNRSWEGGENIVIICEIQDITSQESIKAIIEKDANAFFKKNPAPEKKIELPINDWFLPFPNNYIHFNDHFLFDIMETGGLQASKLAEDLLCNSSKTILNLIDSANEDWNIDSALGIAMQFHLVLLLAFDKDIENISHFYNAFLDNILAMVEGETDSMHFKQELIEGLDSNFNDQKEGLLGFTGYIIGAIQENSDFDEEWLNDWSVICTKISAEIKALQSKGEFIATEQFRYNNDITPSLQTQELWNILEYYLRAINCQLGITNAYEINLVYSLRESLRFLSTTMETKN